MSEGRGKSSIQERGPPVGGERLLDPKLVELVKSLARLAAEQDFQTQQFRHKDAEK